MLDPGLSQARQPFGLQQSRAVSSRRKKFRRVDHVPRLDEGLSCPGGQAPSGGVDVARNRLG